MKNNHFIPFTCIYIALAFFIRINNRMKAQKLSLSPLLPPICEPFCPPAQTIDNRPRKGQHHLTRRMSGPIHIGASTKPCQLHGCRELRTPLASTTYNRIDNPPPPILRRKIGEESGACSSLHLTPSNPYQSRSHGTSHFVIPNCFVTSAVVTPFYGRRSHIPKHRCFFLYGLVIATSFPGTAALLFDAHLPGSKRVIAGVISTSAGIALVPLQAEGHPTALLYMVGILWAMTYGAFLIITFQRVMRRKRSDGPIYLFCALLLAAHFVFGFAKAAETTREATRGLFMFGPLVTTSCAALVYIPFRYRAGNPTQDYERSASSPSGESISMRISRNGDRPHRHDDQWTAGQLSNKIPTGDSGSAQNPTKYHRTYRNHNHMTAGGLGDNSLTGQSDPAQIPRNDHDTTRDDDQEIAGGLGSSVSAQNPNHAQSESGDIGLQRWIVQGTLGFAV